MERNRQPLPRERFLIFPAFSSQKNVCTSKERGAECAPLFVINTDRKQKRGGFFRPAFFFPSNKKADDEYYDDAGNTEDTGDERRPPLDGDCHAGDEIQEKNGADADRCVDDEFEYGF